MANKNINELEVLEALEGGEKVLLSTDNGAKLFDTAGIASSGGGAGEDITIVLQAQVDPEGYGDPIFDELVIKRVECSITEEQFWTYEEYKKFSDEIMDKPIYYYAFEVLYWCGIREGVSIAF